MSTKIWFVILGVIVLSGLVIMNPNQSVSEFFSSLLIGISLIVVPIFIVFKIVRYKEKTRCDKCQRWQKHSLSCHKHPWDCPALDRKVFDD
jgi:uncharacterized membrane protein HdeD (DUF308 family)